MATLTDWLASPDIQEYVRVRDGLWVRLVSQYDGSQYISTGATDEEGAWTIDPRPPSGTYTMDIATSSIGPWIPTGYTYEVSTEESGLVRTSGDQTISGTKTFTGRPVVPSDYVDLVNAQTIDGVKTFIHPPVMPSWVDVLAKGADPTGGVDSTAALNDAVTAGAGGTVYVPKGTYKVSGSIFLPSNTTLYGPGTMLVAAGSNFPGPVLHFNGNNITVRDVTVDGNKASQASGNTSDGLIEVFNAGNKLQGVTVQNAWNRGIFVFTGSDHLIEKCVVLNNGSGNDGASSTMSSIVLLDTARARVLGNRVNGSGGSGILHSNSQGSMVSGNSVKGIYFIGIGLGTDSSDMTVTDNIVDATGQTGGAIDIGNVRGATIEGNTAYSTDGLTGTGVVNGGPSFDVTISGNEFRHMYGGIWYGGGTGDNAKENTTIIGNVCNDMVDVGIQLGSVGDVILSANECMNCGKTTSNPDHKAGIFLYGDGTQGWCNDVLITGNRCGDNQAVKTQSYGLRIVGASNLRTLVGLNNFHGNAVASILDDSAAGTTLGTNVTA